MTELILALSALIFLSGLIILVSPEIIFGYLRRNVEQPAIHILAVSVRLVFGVLLILESDVSKYPLVIEIIGWLSIVAAISLAFMGRQNFLRLMAWALNFLKPYGRVGGLIAAGFSGFLVYAFI